ncbi:unnamed protein product [Symbiodinium microadriaticum]|nr:unnamed protein product [Symbiodinium microadriaticum]CAE7915333.1 unnamed protein product [Symbiodinium sp. KB8]
MAGDPIDAFDYPGSVPTMHRQNSVDSSSSSDSGPMMTRRDADGHLGARSRSAQRRREAALDFCPEPRSNEAQVVDSSSPVTVHSNEMETAPQRADDKEPFLKSDADGSTWCAIM